MDGFCVDGAPVCVPVRLRSAADVPSERTGVKVGNCGEGAGLLLLDLLPKHISSSPVMWKLSDGRYLLVVIDRPNGLAVLGHEPVLAEQPHKADEGRSVLAVVFHRRAFRPCA
jgi:hypothetical protein